MTIFILNAQSDLARQVQLARHYHSVSQEFGPDPTLIAFIGASEGVGGADGAGLESLDLLEDHMFLTEGLLSEQSLNESALEELTEIFAKITDWDNQVSEVSLLGGIAIEHITNGVVIDHITNDKTVTMVDLAHAITLHSQLVDDIAEFCNHVPQEVGLESWNNFYILLGNQSEIWSPLITETKEVISSLPVAKFEESDWSSDKFSELSEQFANQSALFSNTVNCIKNTSMDLYQTSMESMKGTKDCADTVSLMSESIWWLDSLVTAAKAAHQVIENHLDLIAYNYKKA